MKCCCLSPLVCDSVVLRSCIGEGRGGGVARGPVWDGAAHPVHVVVTVTVIHLEREGGDATSYELDRSFSCGTVVTIPAPWSCLDPVPSDN